MSALREHRITQAVLRPCVHVLQARMETARHAHPQLISISSLFSSTTLLEWGSRKVIRQ